MNLDEVDRYAAQIYREQGEGAFGAYVDSLDQQTLIAYHVRLLAQQDATKRDLQQALDDCGILNDPASSRWQRFAVRVRKWSRQRRYRRRERGI